jgi:hypothetical protein
METYILQHHTCNLRAALIASHLQSCQTSDNHVSYDKQATRNTMPHVQQQQQHTHYPPCCTCILRHELQSWSRHTQPNYLPSPWSIKILGSSCATMVGGIDRIKS